jgi:hypothetical protein
VVVVVVVLLRAAIEIESENVAILIGPTRLVSPARDATTSRTTGQKNTPDAPHIRHRNAQETDLEIALEIEKGGGKETTRGAANLIVLHSSIRGALRIQENRRRLINIPNTNPALPHARLRQENGQEAEVRLAGTLDPKSIVAPRVLGLRRQQSH